jgi:predicted PurR-regulated permease PerM
MSLQPSPQSESPKWSSTTKTVVGLTFALMVLVIVTYFRNIIGPLLLAFILAFLLQPIAGWVTRTIHSSWRWSVNIIYVILALIVIGLITLSGLAIFQQAQSLVSFLDRFFQTLPDLVNDLSARTYTLGPFHFSFSQVDLQAITDQIINTVRPIVGQAGSLLGKFATSAATFFGWGFFVFIISYFLLAEGKQLRMNLLGIEIPGYNWDIQLLGQKLSATWSIFFRRQLLISLLTAFSYYIMLTILGVRLSIVIALMAGLARFVPYLGPFITWSTTAIVTFLQAGNYFGLAPLAYTILVIACCIILDMIFDNMVVPRMLGQALGLHPAAVLIAAIISARFIGLIGVVLAAPMLATINLVGSYIVRKMFDMPPWPDSAEEKPIVLESPWTDLSTRIRSILPIRKQRKN